MDIILIGQFLKEQRKAKNLTQQELADKIGVSQKTVSKWECGNGLPDATLMIPLCDELEISVNELLSGKKLSEEDYKSNAEQNFMELKIQQEKTTKFLLYFKYVIGYIAAILFGALMSVAIFSNLLPAVKIILLVLSVLFLFVGISLLIGRFSGCYECKKCGHKCVPTINQVFWALHIGRRKFMKCPKCGKRSWHKKVVEK
ncbi:MAG: helix-turn-helix domain-containing protein [Clostridia bacterium]|nr:helix-turn-helix domain-containing protein [Clostridia bacterium]